MRTLSRGEMIHRLYRRLRMDLERASGSFESGNREEALGHTDHGLRVLEELQSSLDLESENEVAREIAGRLLSLYLWFSREIVQIHGERDPQRRLDRLEKVVSMVRELEDAFRLAAKDGTMRT